MGRIQDFGQLSIRFFTLMINGKRRKLVLELIFEFISMKDFERLTLIDIGLDSRVGIKLSLKF